jgi:hypothetical protein
MRTRIITQLCNYERKLKFPANDIDATPKVRYSGKSHGPDDLAMCMQINAIAYVRRP